MKATVCVGNIFSLSCGNDQYILHILYEQYSYSPTDKCHYDPGHCSQAEIINPVSAQKCNGYSHCSFPIPSGFILQVCGSQNATSFTVFYDCFSSKYFSLRAPFYHSLKRIRNITGVYLRLIFYLNTLYNLCWP